MISAQEAPAADGKTAVQDIVVTASRHEAEVFESPYTIHLFSANDIRMEKVSRSLPEILRDVPSVLVQKTSNGQGSPYIRGLTGYYTLMMIDGIRLNNSVLRFGPNQYWSTIDPLTIERLEVVEGPGSVLYGSDAVGGTVNVLTINPPEAYRHREKVYARYASAEDSLTGRAEFSGAIVEPAKLSIIAGLSRRNFGDVEAGRGMGEQPYTGYDETDGDLKLVYGVAPGSKLIFAYQQVSQNEVPRTHKTIYAKSYRDTDVGTERRRELDQDRNLTYLQYRTERLGGFVEGATFSVSFQSQEEVQDRLKGAGKGGDRQGFDADTTGIWAQFESPTPYGHLTYGVEYYHDEVDSFKREYKEDGSLKAVKIQGPVADDATYDLLGLYLQNEFPLAAKWEMTLGVRYTRASADADKVDIGGESGAVDDDWNSVVGSARLLYRLDKNWNLFGGVSQGFRAPNLSDLTTLDETSAVEIPSPDLEPEEFVAFELGAKARHNRWSGQISYWYTFIDDMIVQSPTGNDIGGTPEVRKDNIGDGYAHCVEAEAAWYPWDEWKFFGNFTLMRGEVDQLDEEAGFTTVRKPLSRLMPMTANLGARYEPSKSIWWIEGVATAVDNQDKLALRDETDTSRIPPGGTPGYTIYTLRGGVKVCENARIIIAVENIADKNYRVHGSGQNEPGTNFILGSEIVFCLSTLEHLPRSSYDVAMQDDFWTRAQEGERDYWRSDFARTQEGNPERRRDLWNGYLDHLRRKRPFHSGDRVLDVGCGPAGIITAVETHCERYGVDPLMDFYRKEYSLPEGIHFSGQTGERLEFADGFFHAATCVNVLDHTRDPQAVCNELFRVLQPGGYLLVEVDTFKGLRYVHKAFKRWTRMVRGRIEKHPHTFRASRVIDMIERSGFEIIEHSLRPGRKRQMLLLVLRKRS